MFNIEEIMTWAPYCLDSEKKRVLYEDGLSKLTHKHYNQCKPYENMLNNFQFNINKQHEVDEIPFLPVRLFKQYELHSVPQNEIIKTMTSSGTTGQQVSKIFLDRKTSMNQTKALVKISSEFLGTKRLPMLIIDTKSVVKDRKLFSARGAGILGFSMLGRDITYALDEEMNLDIHAVERFLEIHKDEDIFVFGFTFMIWEHFYKALKTQNKIINLSRGIMFHGGGFKKLMEQAVDNNEFKKRLQSVCHISRIHNYYGMVEQTGSIFVECEEGNLHTSIFSDIIIRNPRDFSICKEGEKGFIQLVSLLPESYPGHSLLSEDIGEIIGEDNCSCGRLGKIFKIHGRIKQAEIRGCSDTYERR